MEDSDFGLLAIALSDSEDSSSSKPKEARTRAEKTAQSEEAFQAIRASYEPKIENGEIWKSIQLPLGDCVSKAKAQELLHAVEELYFYRRYEEAVAFLGKVSVHVDGPHNDIKEMLLHYEKKCLEKMQNREGQAASGSHHHTLNQRSLR